ncbi:GGDEF domain-containing protein [Neptuniibacter halophilus]|uniref:GGDEF domain-containing protein n=1 Tax=Neptuniibacter halophilus TaxID=651666 RepID=UPI002573D753|nr:GGDEF domain-containing protein [Neptuniibacter halophilus]
MTAVALGYTLLGLLMAFFSLVWWGCSRYNRTEKRYCLLTCAYTALWGLGIICISLRGSVPDWASYQLSNVSILAGFVLMVVSFEEHFKLVSSRLLLLPLLLVSAVLLLFLGHSGAHYFERLQVLAVSSVFCCCLAISKASRPLYREHGPKVCWFVIGIGIVATGLWFLRLKLGGEMAPNEVSLVSDSAFNLYALFIIWLTIISFQGCMLFLLIARHSRKLQDLSTRDFLTGTENRMGLERVWKELGAVHDRLSVLIMDIDHFKQVNDSYGHAIGDEILKLVVARAHSVIRQEDTLARFGGEEFVVVLPGSDEVQAQQMAERIRSVIERHRFRLENLSVGVTVSIGIALHTGPQTDADLERLIRQADMALYRAKKQGRNQVVVGEAVMVAQP